MRAADQLVIPNRTSSTSNAGAPFTSNDSIFHIMRLLGDGEPARESTANSAVGTADRAWSATAVRRSELAGGTVVPRRCGLLVHLRGELRQDVGCQLSVCVGLGNIVTELGWGIAIIHHGWVLVRNGGLVGSNNWVARRDMLRCHGVWVLVAPVNELSLNVLELGTARGLLGVSMNDTVLVDGKRRIVSKLVAGGRRRLDGRLAAFNHVNNGSMCNIFHIFRRTCVKVIIAIVLHTLIILVLVGRQNNLNLTTKHHAKAIATGGFFDAGNARPVTPFVQFSAKDIGLGLEHAEFAGSNQPVTA